MSTKLGEVRDLNSTTSKILGAHDMTGVVLGTAERNGQHGLV